MSTVDEPAASTPPERTKTTSLVPFVSQSSSLVPFAGARIARNSLVSEQLVEMHEDASRPVRLMIYRLHEESFESDLLLSFDSGYTVSRVAIKGEIEPALIDSVVGRIASLPEEWYEIFPEDHNLNNGFHFPDPWGEATQLLSLIESRIPTIRRPPVNHNKVSSRRFENFSLSGFHVDSFEGMRTTNGRRTAIWRYFINLGQMTRWTAVIPADPAILNELVPIDYQTNFLDPVFDAFDWTVPVLLVPTPGRETHRAYAVKLCPTHMLHCEYGASGDLLAIVNSLE